MLLLYSSSGVLYLSHRLYTGKLLSSTLKGNQVYKFWPSILITHIKKLHWFTGLFIQAWRMWVRASVNNCYWTRYSLQFWLFVNETCTVFRFHSELGSFRKLARSAMDAKIMVWKLKKKGYYVMYKLGFKRDNWFWLKWCCVFFCFVFFGGGGVLSLVERYPLGSNLGLRKERDNWFLIVQLVFWVISLALVERCPLGSKLALPCIRLFT